MRGRVGRAERHPPSRGHRRSPRQGPPPHARARFPPVRDRMPGNPADGSSRMPASGPTAPHTSPTPQCAPSPRLQARGGDTVDQRAITAHAHRSHDSCRRRPAPGRRTSGRRPPRGRPDWRLNDFATASDPSDHARYGRAVRNLLVDFSYGSGPARLVSRCSAGRSLFAAAHRCDLVWLSFGLRSRPGTVVRLWLKRGLPTAQSSSALLADLVSLVARRQTRWAA